MDAVDSKAPAPHRDDTRAIVRHMAVKAAVFLLLPMAAAAIAILVLM